MLKDCGFLTWLAVFALVAGTLVALLWPESARYPSIGGGGYDLSDWVYTLALLAFTGVWTLATLLVGLNRSTPQAAKRAYWLAAIGAVTFVASVVAFGHHVT